eukprot:gene27219-2468_t
MVLADPVWIDFERGKPLCGDSFLDLTRHVETAFNLEAQRLARSHSRAHVPRLGTASQRHLSYCLWTANRPSGDITMSATTNVETTVGSASMIHQAEDPSILYEEKRQA